MYIGDSNTKHDKSRHSFNQLLLVQYSNGLVSSPLFEYPTTTKLDHFIHKEQCVYNCFCYSDIRNSDIRYSDPHYSQILFVFYKRTSPQKIWGSEIYICLDFEWSKEKRLISEWSR